MRWYPAPYLGGLRAGQGEAQPHKLWGSEWVKVGLSPIGWGAQSGSG